MTTTSRVCLAALLAVVAVSSWASKEPWEEYDKYVERSRAISPHGDNFAGDSISLQSGGLSFRQVDIALRGNNRLPVELVRSFSTKTKSLTLRSGVPSTSNQLNAPLGDWDLDLPYVGGVFALSTGWVNPVPGIEARRCTITAPSQAAAKSVSVNGQHFNGHEIWSGTRLNIPGRGSRSLLMRAGTTPQPAAGGAYWLSSDWTSVSCLSSIPGAAGEGFLATDAEGVTYRLDWLAVTPEMPLAKRALSGPGYNVLPRGNYRLYATQVQDRFGNWVKYSYGNAHDQPLKLDRIESSDGRVISFTHANGRIQSASAHGKTWTYGYSAQGFLSSVTQPDNRSWTLALPDFQNLPIRYYQGEPGEAWRSCGNPGDVVDTSYEGSITHPSGATARFTLKPMRFERAGVDYASNCALGKVSDPNDDQEWYPTAWDAYAVVSKQLTGAAAPTATWSYTYDRGYTTSVTGPDEFARYRFGNSFRTDEGKLLKLERGTSSSQILDTQTSSFELALSGQPYPTPIGDSGQSRSSAFDDEYPRPAKSSVITRQGVSFSRVVSSFDGLARPLSTTLSSTVSGNPSRIESTAYHDNLSLWVLGQIASVTELTGNRLMSESIYNGMALPIEHREFGVTRSTQTWNTDGTLATYKVGASSHVHSFSNYQRGIARSIAYPNGASQSAVVDDHGLITSITNKAGFSTGYGYDAMGRLASITPPPGFTGTTLDFQFQSSSAYGLPAGHWRQTIAKGNARTVTLFDAFWRPVMTRAYDSASEATTRKVSVKTYNASGKRVFESYPRRDFTTVAINSPGQRTEYDALDRPIRVVADSELGPLVSTTDYLANFETRSTNPRGYATTQSFWALDKPDEAALVGISAPEGVSVSIARDLFGKPTSISRGGVTRRYVYDSGQRLCKTLEPEVGATIQTYDAAGNIAWKAPGQALLGTSACDDASVSASTKISYSYNAVNELTGTSYGDGSAAVTRSYTPDGLPETVSSAGSTWTYGYNALRALTSESLAFESQTFGVTRAYNANGDLTTLTYPGGALSLAYSPNALGEASQVGAYASGLSHHPNGAVAGYSLGNGIAHSLSLNTRDLPLLHRGAGVLQDQYSYDANGNVSGIADQQEGVFGRSMSYDGLDRLTATLAPNVWGTASYSYDAADNLRSANVGSRSVTLHYTDGTNRLNSITQNGSPIAYGYDPRGNVSAKGGQSFAFDLGNRLSSSSLGGGYVYDGHGRRIKLVSSDGSTRLQVYTSDGKLMWSTNVGGGRPSSSTAYVYVGGKLIAEWDTVKGTQYIHTDALGSPVARTNGSGGVIGRTRYEPFGFVAAGTKPSAAAGLIGFTGHVQDAETDLVYMQQRYYDSIAGRFLSVDPVVTDANNGKMFGRYHYGENNPYKYTDPDGRSPQALIEATQPGGMLEGARKFWNNMMGPDRPSAGDRQGSVTLGGTLMLGFIGVSAEQGKAMKIGANEVFDTSSTCLLLGAGLGGSIDFNGSVGFGAPSAGLQVSAFGELATPLFGGRGEVSPGIGSDGPSASIGLALGGMIGGGLKFCSQSDGTLEKSASRYGASMVRVDGRIDAKRLDKQQN